MNQLIRVSVILAVINALILLLVTLLGGVFHQQQLASVAGLIVILAIQVVSFLFSDKLVLASSGAQALEESDAPELYAIVRSVASSAGVTEPKLYLIDSSSLNAFTTGRSRNSSVVVLTRGIVEHLTKEELTGVIAHEIAHIRHNDVRLMTYVSVAVGCISILAELLRQSQVYGKASEKDTSGMLHWLALILAVFSPIVATVFQFMLSRTREYGADRSAARSVGSARGLAGALRKIARDHQPLPASYATAHLYIANPFKADGFLDTVFATHPPISKRIEVLERMHI